MTTSEHDDARRELRRRERILDLLRVLLSLLAVGLVVLGLFILRESSRSRGWQPVSGRVVSSSVSDFTGKDGAHSYRPMVVFAYSVGALRLMSNRISFRSLSTADRGAAETFVRKYPVGKTVQVYYDPQEPDRAVLEPAGNPWLPLLAGGACSFAAVGTGILRRRVEKRGTPRS
jgi:hypothetical protein